MRAVWGGVFALAAWGCSPSSFELKELRSPAGMAAVDNSLRVVVAFKTATGYRFCVEPVGPVAKLQNIDIGGNILSTGTVHASGSAEGSGKSDTKDGKTSGAGSASGEYGTTGSIGADVRVAIAQSLARIYEIGEIMQLAHAMSFRLCEARASGDIKTEKEYLASLQHIYDQTSFLMAASAAHDAAAALPVLAAELQSIQRRDDELLAQCKAESAELKTVSPETNVSDPCDPRPPVLPAPAASIDRPSSDAALRRSPPRPADPALAERLGRLRELKAQREALAERAKQTIEQQRRITELFRNLKLAPPP